jgi:hypothetical protein
VLVLVLREDGDLAGLTGEQPRDPVLLVDAPDLVVADDDVLDVVEVLLDAPDEKPHVVLLVVVRDDQIDLLHFASFLAMIRPIRLS